METKYKVSKLESGKRQFQTKGPIIQSASAQAITKATFSREKITTIYPVFMVMSVDINNLSGGGN